MIPTILNSIIILFSFSATGAVLMHDTNVDKAFVKAVNVGSSSTTSTAPGADAHTHVRSATSHNAGRDIRNSHPRVLPNQTTERRYVIHKSTRGHHPFDDYLLPALG